MHSIPRARTLPQQPLFFSFHALVLLLVATLNPPAAATELWREKNQLDELRPHLPAHELIELPTRPLALPALYRKTRRADIQGAAIILHPPGQHLDFPGPVHDLRRQLPRHGWSTLSLPMPLLRSDTSPQAFTGLLQESSARLRAAVNFLNQERIQNIVIIGQGLSASYAVGFVTQSALANQTVQALVAISWPSHPHLTDWLNASAQLARLKLPLLDIYAELDSPAVLADLPRRLEAAHLAGQLFDKPLVLEDRSLKVANLARRKTGNLRYRQVEVKGSGPLYHNQSDTLVKIIRGWIQRYAAGIEATIQ